LRIRPWIPAFAGTTNAPLDAFTRLDTAAVRTLVRRGYEPHAALLSGAESAADGERVRGGRAEHPLVTLPGGERAVVRAYHRGGLMRHLNRSRYFVGERAFAEALATERARQAGVRVPVVLAATEHPRGIGYTASLATLWIAGSEELAAWLAAGQRAEVVVAVMGEVGRQIARMHAGGVAHPDLNLRNLLVCGGGEELYILDFDRARLYRGAVPPARRARDLKRLARSARKLSAALDSAAWAALRDGYGAAWPFTAALG
jgi:3-deoxy-D-manno-octulosonic acid kinase